ncbi:MAG: ROK family protein [Candidatus Omnitrophota bacterium]|nr:MAG: ROK family protein [Candidatus Omnitrophota bacterium]
MKTFLGIDWGGTYIKAAVLDSKGKIYNKKVFASEELREKKVFIRTLKNFVASVQKFKLKGIGIGAPGIINIRRGFIYYLPNIPGWKNFPLKTILEKELKLPVFIDNDANVFALAEARLGAAKDVERAIFLTLGTGLGGAVIFNGRILEGEVSASEVGHVPLSIDGKLCGCGAKGCIETFVGNRYLLERYTHLKSNKGKASEVKEIFERAQAGEPEALIVWKEFSVALGKFLAGMINIFNPQKIVFGGGVSKAFSIFKPLVWQVIKKQAMWPQAKGVKLVRAKLKNAGVIGAALLAKENIGK